MSLHRSPPHSPPPHPPPPPLLILTPIPTRTRTPPITHTLRTQRLRNPNRSRVPCTQARSKKSGSITRPSGTSLRRSGGRPRESGLRRGRRSRAEGARWNRRPRLRSAPIRRRRRRQQKRPSSSSRPPTASRSGAPFRPDPSSGSTRSLSRISRSLDGFRIHVACCFHQSLHRSIFSLLRNLFTAAAGLRSSPASPDCEYLGTVARDVASEVRGRSCSDTEAALLRVLIFRCLPSCTGHSGRLGGTTELSNS